MWLRYTDDLWYWSDGHVRRAYTSEEWCALFGVGVGQACNREGHDTGDEDRRE